MDDQKEIQMENQRLIEENKALKLNSIHVNKFESFASEIIYDASSTYKYCKPYNGPFHKPRQMLRHLIVHL